MNYDITFCANADDCVVASECKRALTLFVGRELVINNYKPLSFSSFEPEKGKECIGYKNYSNDTHTTNDV